jgi:hypothetical protein
VGTVVVGACVVVVDVVVTIGGRVPLVLGVEPQAAGSTSNATERPVIAVSRERRMTRNARQVRGSDPLRPIVAAWPWVTSPAR